MWLREYFRKRGFPVLFSKYGTCYRENILEKKIFTKRRRISVLESIIKTDLTVGVFLSAYRGIRRSELAWRLSECTGRCTLRECDRTLEASAVAQTVIMLVNGNIERCRCRGRAFQPCPLLLRAGKCEGDRIDIPRHGDSTCRRHGLCGSCGDTVRYGFRRDTYTYRSHFRRG